MTAMPASRDGAQTAEIDPREFRNALGSFATGVTIVTAVGEDGRRVGLTANSFSSVSLDPPLVLWSLARKAPSLSVFTDVSHFAINVLAEDQMALSNRFASPIEDKFEGVDWRPGLGGAPLIEGCVARFECRNHMQHDGGDHVIFVGRVDRFDYTKRAPLLFLTGGYRVAHDHPDVAGGKAS